MTKKPKTKAKAATAKVSKRTKTASEADTTERFRMSETKEPTGSKAATPDPEAKERAKEGRKETLAKLGYGKQGNKITVTKTPRPKLNEPLPGDETGDNPEAESDADYQEGTQR